MVFLPQLTEVWQEERNVNALSATLTPWRSWVRAQPPDLQRVNSKVLSTGLQRGYGWAELHTSCTFLLAFSPSLTYIFCSLPPDPWDHPPGSLKFWSQALCSRQHNPSPLLCFLLIVSLLNLFVTRTPPYLEGKRKGGERKGTKKKNLAPLEIGHYVFWHLEWARDSLTCYLTKILTTNW